MAWAHSDGVQDLGCRLHLGRSAEVDLVEAHGAARRGPGPADAAPLAVAASLAPGA